MTIGLAVIEGMVILVMLCCLLVSLGILYTCTRDLFWGRPWSAGCVVVIGLTFYLLYNYCDLQSSDFFRNINEVLSWIGY